MPQRIEVPGMGIVEFPDGMSDDQISAAIRANMKPAGLTKTPAQEVVQNLAAGLFRGAGSIGATLLTPYDLLAGNTKSIGNPERRQAMDAGIKAAGADTESLAYGGGKLAGEIAGTAGAGGALANTARLLPGAGRVAPLLDSVGTAGFSAGGVGGWGGLGLRTVGGGVVGGTSAAIVNPDDAAAGGAIGAVLPGALKAAGAGGKAVYRAVKPGPAVPVDELLAQALNIQKEQAAQMVAKAKAAPRELVPGSRLTMAQALQLMGNADPNLALLERIVSGGPGGDALLKRYAAQGEARLEALKGQGAQTYQGAAKEEATKAGDFLGSVLRTQAADDKQAAKAAWDAVYKRGADESVKLYLPIDELDAAMKTLGRGTVGAGTDARALLNEARNIGTMRVDAMKPVTDAASARPPTLAQAVRKAGGISIKDNDGLRGELQGLKGDLKNLVRTNGGLPPGRMAEKMREAGYLQDEGSDALFAALRDEANGKAQFSTFDGPERSWQAARDAAMGAPPANDVIPVPVPFDDFQRLRRSAGALGAKVGAREGGAVESGVLNDMQSILSKKVDAAAGGNLAYDEAISPGFANQYSAARDMTRANAEKYKGGNNIAAILRKPVGQDYSLTGDEVFGKVWHGGMGLAGDIQNLKQTLSQANLDPAMRSLQGAIMTDAASKTNAAGNFGAALPKYVESRMPGLQEALAPEQLKVLKDVAADIRNAEAAGSVQGLRGSDTQAKITRALDAGLIDGPLLRTLSRLISVKGVGLESLRAKVAEAVVRSKGEALAGLLADPDTLRASGGLLGAPSRRLGSVQRGLLTVAPVAYAD